MINKSYEGVVATTKKAIRVALPRASAYAAYLKALFENEVELRLLPWLCDPNQVAIDVGAFTGTYTLGLSIYARHVLAVEPQPWQAQLLRSSMPSNVTVVEAALSNSFGRACIKLSSPRGGSMSTLQSRSDTRNWSEISVPVMRIDDLYAGTVGFIKVDAEGHELEILRGGQIILQRDKPNLLVEIEERHNTGSIGRVLSMMSELGYRMLFVRRNRLHEIGDFDLARDQDLRLLLTGGKRRSYRDYINNFVFVHPDRSTTIPFNVGSGFKVAIKTLADSFLRNKGLEF